jgi:hypothetical protein
MEVVSPCTPPAGSPAGKKGSPNLRIQTDGLKVDKDKEVAEPARTPHRHRAALKSLHTVGLFCPYSRSLLTLVLSA